MTRLPVVALLATSVLAPVATAQGRHVFDIDGSQSSFSYSGTVTFSGVTGPIVGNPSTFSPAGASDVDLTVSGSVIARASRRVGVPAWMRSTTRSG